MVEEPSSMTSKSENFDQEPANLPFDKESKTLSIDEVPISNDPPARRSAN